MRVTKSRARVEVASGVFKVPGFSLSFRLIVAMDMGVALAV